MATYPIKMLKDETGNPFVPLVSTTSIQDPGGLSLDQKLATKLEVANIIAGTDITLSTSGNNITISTNVPVGNTLIDNLTTSTAGQGALDAHQGKVLKDSIPAIVDDVTDTSTTKALSANQGYVLNQKFGDYVLSSALETLVKQYILAAHPIGSIEINITGTNPSNYLGGTWIAWGTGQVPVGVDTNDSDFNSVEKTGGSKSVSYTPSGQNSGGSVGNHTYTPSGTVGGHVLQLSEIPSHRHYVSGRNTTYGAGIQPDWQVITSPGSTNGDYTYDNWTDWQGGSGSHDHGFSGTQATLTHSVTQPTFTGTAANINVQQKYITCYMWKRTA